MSKIHLWKKEISLKRLMIIWEANLKIGKNPVPEQTVTLFKTEKLSYKTPKLPSSFLENAFDQLELLGFPLCNPFLLLENFNDHSYKPIDLTNYINKTVTVEGYLITIKNTKTSDQKIMCFGTFIDYDGHFIDTVHFPPIAAKFPFRGKGVYEITGKVLEEFDCITIEVISMRKKAVIEDPRYSESVKETEIKWEMEEQ